MFRRQPDGTVVNADLSEEEIAMREERRKAKIAMELAREEKRKERLQAIKAREERKEKLKEVKRNDKEESVVNRKFHTDNRKQPREDFLIVERNPKGQSQKMLNLNHNLSFLGLLLLYLPGQRALHGVH